jgi:AraC family transcriptional regulator of arabinose operon
VVGLPPPSALAASRHDVPSQVHQELGLWVIGVGYDQRRPGHNQLFNRRLGAYAAVLISQGRGWFVSGPTGRVAVEPGTLFWLFPEIIHSYGPLPGGWWTEQWVTFGGRTADTYRRHGFLAPSRTLVSVGRDAEVAALFQRLQDVYLPNHPLAIPRAGALVHELIVAVHALGSGLYESASHGDPVIAEALKIIERETLGSLTPESLAERLHVGYSTLRRRFRLCTGYALKEYLLRVQLRRAMELLAFSGESIGEIAARTGFQDPYYFSRLFKAREGVSPSAFRERQRQPEPPADAPPASERRSPLPRGERQG